MSSKLPILKHTWQLDVNNVAAQGGSNMANYQESLFALKQAMIGFATLPWTVHSSSNAINHTNDGIPVLAYPDDSTNSNDGTPTDMEATDIVEDTPGGGFAIRSTQFGGSFEAVNMGDASELDFDNTDAFSISCWAKWTSAGPMSVVSKMASPNAYTGYMLFVDAGHVDFFLINNFTGNNYIDVNTTATGFNDGAWHHIVVTYDGSSTAAGVDIYIDDSNEALTVQRDTLTLSSLNSADFTIANRPSSALPYIGTINGLAVYNVELAGSQVTTIYNGGAPNDLRVAGPTANLIGYWLMEGAPTGAADLWITSLNLVWATAPAPHGWIVLQHPARNTQICFDLRNALGRHLGMFISYSGSYSGGNLTERPRAEDEVFVATSSQWLGPLTGAFSSWVHVWHSNDGLRTRAYVATSAGIGYGAFFLFDEIDTPSPNWEQQEIAMVAFHGSVSGGTVLDVDRLLSSNAFNSSNLPDFISGIVAYLGGPLKDTSISRFSMGSTIFNDRSSAETEYALVGDVAPFKFERTDPFSLTCWFRSKSDLAQMIMSKNSGAGTFRGYEIQLATDGTIFFQLFSDVGSGNRVDVFTNDTFDDGLWHHIACTYDGNSLAAGMSIYIDGVAVAVSSTFDALTATIDGTAGFQISGRGGTIGGFVGNIDDAAVYDKELSPEEVATIYNAGNAVLPFTTKSLIFDGVDEYVTIGNVAALSFDNIDPFSISVWVNSVSIGGMIVSKALDPGTYRGYSLDFISANGKIRFLLTNDGSSGPNEINVSTPLEYNDGLWHHVVATYDGSQTAAGCHIWVDGVDILLTVTADALSATIDGGAPFNIGARNDLTGFVINALIDGVAVYDKELSSAEVTAIYNGGNPRLNTLLPSASNLVGYWLMGDNDAYPRVKDIVSVSGSILASELVRDRSQNTNDGTPTNMEDADFQSDTPGGVSGFSSRFDAASEYINFGNVNDITTNAIRSYSIWAKPAVGSVSTWPMIMKFDSGFRGHGIRLHTNGTRIFSYVLQDGAGNSVIHDSDAGIAEDAWSHLVATTTGGVSPTVVLYVNGAVVASSRITDTYAGASVGHSDDFRIGGNAFDDTRSFGGKLDDAAYYDKVLSLAEVQAIYNSGAPVDNTSLSTGPNLLGYWLMGDKFGNDGIMTNMESSDIVNNVPFVPTFTSDGEPGDLRLPEYPTNLIGYWLMGDGDIFPTIFDHTNFSAKALLFDGVDEFVLIGDVTALKFTDTSSFSISGWIKSSSGTNQVIVGKQDGTSGYLFRLQSSGSLLWQIRSGGAQLASITTTATTFADGALHHVVATYDGSTNASGLTIYVDGSVEPSSISLDGLTGTIDTTEPLRIGQENGGANSFNGNIDDVSIYRGELTAGEVTIIYNGGIPNDLRTTGPSANLVGYWLMGDDAISLTIPDESEESNDGTMTNMEITDIVGNGNPATCTGMETEDLTFGDTPGNPMVYVRLGMHQASSAIGSGMALNRRVAASVPNELDGFPWIRDVSASNNAGLATNMEFADIVNPNQLVGSELVPDLSSNGNHGTPSNLENADYTTDTPGGVSEFSVTFDGVNEQITIGNIATFDFEYTDPFSLSMWFKGNPSTSGSIVAKQLSSGTFRGWSVSFSSDGSIYLLLRNTLTTNQIQIHTTATYDDNQWHHIVWTWPGSVTPVASLVSAYVDGGTSEPLTTDTDNLNATIVSAATMEIGSRVSDNFLAAQIDDVAIYDKELSVAEAQAIYGSGAPVDNTTLSTEPNLVGYWAMEADYDTTFSAKAMRFDGVNEYITMGDVHGFDWDDPYSLTCWFKTAVGGDYIISKKDAANLGYGLFMNGSGELRFLHTNNSSNEIDVETVSIFNDGLWHHVVTTYDGSGDAAGAHIYVDGVDETLTVLDDTLTMMTTITAASFNISGRTDGDNFEFDGIIDDVAVYDKDLTSGEVTAIYNGGATPDLTATGPFANLVGYWKMGDLAASPAYPIHPISLMADYGYHGFHGFLDDIWWGSLDLANPSSSTYPNDPDNRQFVQAGEVVFPWTEDATLPLMGGIGVVNDTFDGHFIDTSDLESSGITKYFQMTGIDTGNPSQPAYHSWVVPNASDPTGALAVGPDAPPFGGPLTNIVVSAEWTD